MLKRIFSLGFCFAVGLVITLTTPITWAQDGTWSETFDDPALPDWERSPGVTVADGVARIPDNNLLAVPGAWGDFTLRLRIRRISGEGNLLVHYRASESANNQLSVHGSGFVLGRDEAGVFNEYIGVPFGAPATDWFDLTLQVIGSRHTVMLYDEPLIDFTEPGSPLPPGRVTLHTNDVTVEIDELVLTSGGDGAPPAENPPDTQLETQPPPGQPDEIPTDETGVWVRTGGPPGGLGYDIRYSFANPNIWYVTDNFAGVHISTDNGYTWQPSNTGIPPQLGPTGDWRPIFSLTVDPLNPQIVWAGTDITGHIYKSTDGGQTWTQKDNGIVNEWDELTFRGFTIDPRSSDVVYAMAETSKIDLGGQGIRSFGEGGAVYKTTDGGETWSKIWDGGIPSALARYLWIDPANPDVLYVSTGIFDRWAIGEATEDFYDIPDPWGGLGILKSTDGGQTWRILGEENGLEGLYVGSLYMHPQNPDILLAAVGHEMGYVQVDHLRQEDHSPAGIYRTTDGGETWDHVYEPPVERINEEFSSVEFCVSDPNIAYAGSGSAIYRSEDAGVTWTQVTSGDSWGPPGIRAGWPIDLQCDPRDTNRLFANNYQGGAFLSEDGGRTWINASQGYSGGQMFDIVVDPHDPARIYVVGRSGGWRSDDGGATWVGLRNFTPGEPHPILAEWGTIALNPANPDQIWASDGDGPVIIESHDRGASWTVHIPPEGVRGVVLTYAFTPADPNTILAGYGDLGCLRDRSPCPPTGGVIVSNDGGQTWNPALTEALFTATIADLAINPTNVQIAYAAATESGLFKTTDGGKNWVPLDLSAAVNPATDTDMLYAPHRVLAVTVDPANPQHVVIGVHLQGIFASTDGGNTWQAAYSGLEPNGSIYDIVFDPISSQIVYASDRLSGVYRSTDGGQTWVKMNDGLENRAATWLAISADGRYLYLSTDGHGVYRMAVDR